jgi:hypothetical protein
MLIAAKGMCVETRELKTTNQMILFNESNKATDVCESNRMNQGLIKTHNVPIMSQQTKVHTNHSGRRKRGH